MKNQIVIIGSEPIEEQLTRGNESGNKLQEAIKLGQISADKLSEGIQNIAEAIGKAMDSVDQALEKYELDEITIKLALTASGTIGILGTGVTASGTGGIDLKFKKKAQ